MSVLHHRTLHLAIDSHAIVDPRNKLSSVVDPQLLQTLDRGQVEEGRHTNGDSGKSIGGIGHLTDGEQISCWKRRVSNAGFRVFLLFHPGVIVPTEDRYSTRGSLFDQGIVT